MTPLEQLVWAAAFAQASAESHQAHTCAQRAEAAVQKLRAVKADPWLSDDRLVEVPK